MAWRPASVAIWIGPPMFDESIWRDDELPQALDRQHRHVPRLDRAVARRPSSGLYGSKRTALVRDAGLDPADLDAPRRSGAFSFTGVGRDGQRERLAVALDGERRTPGPAALRIASHEILGREDRLARHGDAPRRPACSPARSAGESALTELICGMQLRAGADVPDLARLPEDRIGDGAQPRRDRHRAARRRRAARAARAAARRTLDSARSRSSQYATGRPLTATTVSPVRRPAAAAGLPSATRPTTGRPHRRGPAWPSTTAKITAASTRFMPGPGEDDQEARPQRLEREGLGRSRRPAPPPPSSGFSSPIIFT